MVYTEICRRFKGLHFFTLELRSAWIQTGLVKMGSTYLSKHEIWKPYHLLRPPGTVSSQSSHHPQEVLLAQFSLSVHKRGLKPDSFHFILPPNRFLLRSNVVVQVLTASCRFLWMWWERGMVWCSPCVTVLARGPRGEFLARCDGGISQCLVFLDKHVNPLSDNPIYRSPYLFYLKE